MPLNEKLNLESISLVWLDSMVNSTQENREIQDRLRSIVNYLQTFDNCEQCENYLRNEINQDQNTIILIVSGRLGQTIIEKIHQLKQIISVFVYCFDKEINESWAKNYKKVRSVCVQVNDLLKQIELDRKRDEHKLNEPIEILSDDDGLIQMLLQINYSLIDRKQFLNICSKEYEGNVSEIENIQEFEHLYSSSNALNYFFKETFLYRLLIKSLQVFNIDMLFLLRFFLQDIEQKLQQCSTVSVPVYRGQFMTNNQIEFMKNSINKNTLRFNSFIIAKTNREQILNSLQNSINLNNLNPVLFHIETNQIGKQFEDFILFPITTKFQIISIYYQNNIYIVKIVVSNSNSSLNKKQKSAIQFGYQLRDIGLLDEAEKIFNRLLSQQPLENPHIYEALARIAQDKGLYDISLQLYEKSLSKVSSKHRLHSLNNIGCIYDYLEQYDLALEFYSNALTLMKNDLERAMCFNNMGITLANQQHFKEALDFFEKSLAIRQKLLKENHPDLGASYTNIGVLCSSMGQIDLALEYYQKALQVFLPISVTVYKAIVCQNMAEIFYEKNQLNEALNYYQQAATIFRKIRPPNHPNLIYIEHNINQLTLIK